MSCPRLAVGQRQARKRTLAPQGGALTCPRLAAATGSRLISLNTERTGAPSSCSSTAHTRTQRTHQPPSRLLQVQGWKSPVC